MITNKIDKKNLLDVEGAARILNCGLGKNLFYKWLRNRGIIDRLNVPRYDLMEKGLAFYEAGVVVRQRSSYPYKKVYFSEKGIEWLRGEINREKQGNLS